MGQVQLLGVKTEPFPLRGWPRNGVLRASLNARLRGLGNIPTSLGCPTVYWDPGRLKEHPTPSYLATTSSILLSELMCVLQFCKLVVSSDGRIEPTAAAWRVVEMATSLREYTGGCRTPPGIWACLWDPATPWLLQHLQGHSLLLPCQQLIAVPIFE